MSSPEGTVDHPARGAYHLFVGNFSYTFLVAIASIVIARLLGPSDYGLYSLALVVPGYLYTAVQLGFNQAAVYYPARYRASGFTDKAYEFIYSVTLFQLLVAAVAIALLIPLTNQIPKLLLDRPELSAIIPFALITVLGHVSYYTVSAGMQGLNRMNWSALLQVLLAVVKLVASVGLVLLGFGVLGAVVGNAAAFILSGFIGLLTIVVYYRKVFPRNFFAHVKTALTYSIPLYIAALVSGLVGPIQNTFLAIFVINQEIGGFSSAGNLGALITLFVYPIATVLFPLFSSISDDRQKLLDLYRLSIRYSTLIIVPITLFLLVAATPIASAVYGRAYSFSGNYLRVMILPNLLVGFGSIVQASLLNSVMKNRS
ncbi:MAG: oligosaccharide flippase family protein, partial [Conexivisphaerales archaeon]